MIIKPFESGHDWRAFLEQNSPAWPDALRSSVGGQKILIATGVGKHNPGVTLDSCLAAALTLRGAEVHVFLCDETLPACEFCMVMQLGVAELLEDGPSKRLCPTCFKPAESVYASMGFKVHRYGDFLSPEDRTLARELAESTPYEEIKNFVFDGMAIGEHALAGALRFLAIGSLEAEERGERVLRRYLEASVLTALAALHLFDKIKFPVASFHHGIYVPQGVVGEAARKSGVRVVNWLVAYRKKCFLFSHDETYHHKLLDEPVSNWEGIEWNATLDAVIKEYLRSRWSGAQDWIWFHGTPEEDVEAIKKETGIDFSKPVIGMLTNVMWDAQLHYRANAFPGMIEWVNTTISYFEKRPDLQLVIRIHPAEIRGGIPSRQPIENEIRKAYPTLPPNVFIVPAGSELSTYVLMSLCDSALIYGTKTGVELTSMGIPVVVAGEAWIKNKGLTLDASSRDQYLEILGRLPLGKRLDEGTSEKARKYAFHFFFRRMIEVACIEPTNAWPPYVINVSSLGDLASGADPGLDVICEGIMNGAEFIYRSEDLLGRKDSGADADEKPKHDGKRLHKPGTLSVVVGTYNRLDQLKKCIDSILSETSREVRVYVTDAGSTDGTIEYLKSAASERVIPILVGRKLGQAKAYNDVFSIVETEYVCWLSDDNVIVNRGLDAAVDILEGDRSIGMVGLKIKDTLGPFVDAPYVGGVSSIGILNVNQGVLPARLMKRLGGFSEEFRDYGIDPDLTARVLFAGYKVVYTKKTSVHHYRNWPADKDSKEYQAHQEKQKKYLALYNEKFSRHAELGRAPLTSPIKDWISGRVGDKLRKNINRSSADRDRYNIIRSRYISLFDKLLTAGKDYHLVQALPWLQRVGLRRQADGGRQDKR